MRSLLLTSIICLLLVTNLPAQDIPIRLNRNAINEIDAKTRKGDVSTDSIYDLQSKGTDPHIYSSPLPGRYNTDSLCYISFDYLAPLGLDNLQVYFGPPFSETRCLKVGRLAPEGKFTNFRINIKQFSGFWNKAFGNLRFDVGNTPNQKISIKNIKLTKQLPSEINHQLVKDSKEINNYLNAAHANKITGVRAGKTTIVIKGLANKPNLYLCELRMYDNFSNAIPASANITPITPVKAAFEIRKDRFTTIGDSSYDRMFSRWIIASKVNGHYQVQSYAHYTDDVYEAAYQYLPEEKPTGKKGLAGFINAGNTTPDLKDLDIKSTTINVIITLLVSLKPTPYSYSLNGNILYFNGDYINSLDNTLKTCSRQNIFVSAILIIPQKVSPDLKAIFVYPYANAGDQSMANLTSLTGLNYYRGAVGFLAERYSKSSKDYGRIHNWIVHNEVDLGYALTNAGDMKMENYAELYDRSLRTVYYTVRQYNPSAKVFLSLTHYWNATINNKFFPPNNFLRIFNDLSSKQGDYEWGVAYHPYPQDLFQPKTWNDADVTNDVNTTDYITPKNIEIIDEWMRMKSHLYNGLKMRTLLFSEQGVHTPTYDSEDLKVQAAAIAYMWKKFNRLPSLEAFDYHRADDDRSESGLLLGLWTVKPGTNSDPDVRKTSWYVYQKAGTVEEDKEFSFALPIIGIKSWTETFNTLKGETMPFTVTFRVIQNGLPQEAVEIYFNGEMHKTINGTATFYNVASPSAKRTYKLVKEGKSIGSEGIVIINKSDVITINLSG